MLPVSGSLFATLSLYSTLVNMLNLGLASAYFFDNA